MNLIHTLVDPRGLIRGGRGTPRGRNIRGRRDTVTKRGKAVSRGRRLKVIIRGVVINMKKEYRNKKRDGENEKKKGVSDKRGTETTTATMREIRRRTALNISRHPCALGRRRGTIQGTVFRSMSSVT